ncbi:MAG: GlcG/HbpS family heme-binding protein [Qingshengfaniella sp.]
MNITLEQAREIVAAGQKAAVALGKPMTIVVCDTGGFIVACDRMDGARPLTPQIAHAKAYTGAIMQRPGTMLKGWAEGQPGFWSAVSQMGQQPIVATHGAITIKKDGDIIGGLGASGGTGEEDEALCIEVLSQLGYDTNFAEWNKVR